MLNTKSIEVVRNSLAYQDLRRSIYDSYSLLNIPGSVYKLFGLESSRILPADVFPQGYRIYKKVVVLFIDAMGWNKVEKFKEHKLLKHFFEKGNVSLLTSNFPSTTAACLTTLHTGLSTVESGLVEWQYYNRRADEVILPFKFKRDIDVNNDSLLKLGIKEEDVFPECAYYEKLLQNGIKSYVYGNSLFTPSTYSNYVMNSADLVPYSYLDKGLKHLAKGIKSDESAFHFFYMDAYDSFCHKNGPDCQAADEFLLEHLDMINDLVLSESYKDTLFVLAADHGQIQADPNNTVFIDQIIPVEKYLRTSKSGRILAPAGGTRDMIFYVKPHLKAEFMTILQEKIGARGYVEDVQKLFAEGIFGPGQPANNFQEASGDVILIARGSNIFWWSDDMASRTNKQGFHGGMSPVEMEIPFFTLSL